MRLAQVLGLSIFFAVATPVAAQTHSSSVGLNGGAVLFSSFNSGADAEVDLKPDIGFVGNAQYDWLVGSGHVGFRFAGHYQQMQLDWSNGQRKIYAWSGDFDLLLRPIRPNPDTRVIPFLSLGIGATHYNFGDGNPTSYEPSGALYDGEEKTQFSVLGGIAFDIVTGWAWDEGPFMIRIEAQDNYVLESPFKPIDGSADFGGVHNLRLTIGLHNSMGPLR